MDIREMSVSVALRKIASLLFQIAENMEKDARNSSEEFLLKQSGQKGSELYALEREQPLFASIAEDEYKARQMRNAHLKSELLGEPAWDILLDLYIQHSQGKRVNASSACIASNAPQATALRYLGALEKEGFVERSGSTADKRIVYYGLTEMGLRRMGRYLREKTLR